MLCNFCEQYDVEIDLATHHLQNGTCCEQTAKVGRCLVGNWLQNILEDLGTRPHEFCQMINCDTDICEHCWAHFAKVNSLEGFLKCLTLQSEEQFHRQIAKMERSFGLLSQIDNLSIIRDTIMEDRSLRESEKVAVLFKHHFTSSLVKANEDEICLLHKHIAGEIHALGH